MHQITICMHDDSTRFSRRRVASRMVNYVQCPGSQLDKLRDSRRPR